MAAARSVIVRFTSSSTSTTAPAAARLASLRQRVLQAPSSTIDRNHLEPHRGSPHCSSPHRRPTRAGPHSNPDRRHIPLHNPAHPPHQPRRRCSLLPTTGGPRPVALVVEEAPKCTACSHVLMLYRYSSIVILQLYPIVLQLKI